MSSSDCQELLHFVEGNSHPRCPVCHHQPVPPSLRCPRCGFEADRDSPELLWCTRSLERDGLSAPVIAGATAIAFEVPPAQRELLVSLWTQSHPAASSTAKSLAAFLKLAPELDPQKRHQFQYRHAAHVAKEGRA